jgi:hypothetical protein
MIHREGPKGRAKNAALILRSLRTLGVLCVEGLAAQRSMPPMQRSPPRSNPSTTFLAPAVSASRSEKAS